MARVKYHNHADIVWVTVIVPTIRLYTVTGWTEKKLHIHANDLFMLVKKKIQIF